MILIELKKVLVKDLTKLKEEIASYRQEENLWKVEPGIANAAGNLALHLVGNLNHFIGTVLGNTGYVRNRDAEFSSKNIPQAELLTKITETIAVMEQVLSSLPEEKLQQDYPVVVFKEKTTTAYFLFHLAAHLGYHLGQINYHRRLLDVKEQK